MAQRVADDQIKGTGISAAKGEESAAKDGEEKPQKQGPRKRVSQACDKCRARKDKCDGKKPSCSTCISNSRVCSYDANVKKRGLPEGYVRGLEKLWGLAIRDIDEVEDNVLSALAVDEDSNETPLAIWNDESTSEALVEIWRKSQIWRELEKLLSSQEPNIGDFKRKRATSDIPAAKRVDYGASLQSMPAQSTSLEEQAGFVKTSWPERRLEQRPSDYQNTPNSSAIDDSAAFVIREYDSILSPSHSHAVTQAGVPTSLECPELPSETWHLIDVYFSYTHPWLPILEKHDLLKTSYQYSQNRTSMNPASGENAVLWATIAYAKFQHRSINNIPRALGALSEMVWTAERMYNQARALIPNEERPLELGHVQALLILTLANIGIGHYSRAWSLIGQAVRIAIDLQLDKPLDPILSALKTKSRSKHVFLGCFVVDTLVSFRLGRRPHLRSADIDSIGLIDEDGLEEWDPWTDCLAVRRDKQDNSRVPASILSTFNRLISVSKILNDTICISPNIASIQPANTILEKLHVWAQSISPSPYLDSAMENDAVRSLLPHQYHLYNVYFTTLATSQLLSYNCRTDSVSLEPCTISARHVVKLLHRHSNEFGMLIVPPTYECFVKTAYDVIHAVNSSIESPSIKLNDWRHTLDVCLDALEPAWPIFETFKASSIFQASQGRRGGQVAFDLISGVSQDVETPMTGQTPQSFASYDIMGTYSPHNFRPQTSGSQQFRRAMGNTPKSHKPHQSSSGQSSGHGLPQNPLAFYQNAHVTYGNLKSSSDKIHQKLTPPAQTFSIPTPSQPTQHRSLTMSSTDLDFSDPMFNELMRLDATEWAGNSYQSLVNLGFSDTDPANMNQDFYTFCQEPDPLSQIDVFQQLVNGANAEAIDLFDGSAFGDLDSNMGLGLSGFGDFGNGLGDGDSIEEAGQILAALRKS